MSSFTNDPTQRKTEVEVRRHQSDTPWSYSDLDARQRDLAGRARSGGKGALLLSEVAPVITYGRRTPPQHLLLSQQELSKKGIELCPSDRGGFATYHGPGQWLLFPVDRLESLTGDPRGVRKGVESLLNIALRVGLRYSSEAHIRTGCEMGVWTSKGKFAAVGVHIEQGVLLHGLSVNGFRTSTSFVGLRPCGLDAPVDFLLKDSSEEEFQTLGNQMLEECFREFWCSKLDSSLTHPG